MNDRVQDHLIDAPNFFLDLRAVDPDGLRVSKKRLANSATEMMSAPTVSEEIHLWSKLMPRVLISMPPFQESGLAKQRIPICSNQIDQTPGLFLPDASLPRKSLCQQF